MSYDSESAGYSPSDLPPFWQARRRTATVSQTFLNQTLDCPFQKFQQAIRHRPTRAPSVAGESLAHRSSLLCQLTEIAAHSGSRMPSCRYCWAYETRSESPRPLLVGPLQDSKGLRLLLSFVPREIARVRLRRSSNNSRPFGIRAITTPQAPGTAEIRARVCRRQQCTGEQH